SRPRAITTAGACLATCCSRSLWMGNDESFSGLRARGSGLRYLPDAGDEPLGLRFVSFVGFTEHLLHHLLFWSQTEGDDQSHRDAVSWAYHPIGQHEHLTC